MDILEKIVIHKRGEVAARRLRVAETELERSPGFSRPVISFRDAISAPGSTGIIAEFKRRSPSKGIINGSAGVADVTRAYASNGAAALSVLTDRDFFGGSDEDLKAARFNNIPILRKDFIIDEYQVIEARAIGADVILMIAACLMPVEVKRLAAFAHSLGLEVLLEIHDETELGHICDDCDVVGVNNRNLKDFSVDIKRSLELSDRIPSDKLKISESGISDPETIWLLRDAGFSGFLIGENFMKQDDPAVAFASFVNVLKRPSPRADGRT